MAATDASSNIHEVARVLESLELSRKDKRHGGLAVKKTSFKVKSSPTGIQVDSWRLHDWDYKRPSLPTYARGFFTTAAAPGREPEIAIRGYDKFFNVGEVDATKWNNIFSRTQPPYELTLKENGCIIFLSGLEDGTLLVCSKHSTGDRADISVSHASAGESRLERQLASIGKTKMDLAKELRARNVTAVAELCDDSFEEHILAYGPDKAGLYLHGINFNLPKFATYPSSAVQKFAREWAFRETGFIVMDDLHQVKAFLEETANTGSHNGRDVEGFVIRCRMSRDPASEPYQDWFFKYKFEEPYLMYRQWRECTKALIAGKPPRYKKHARITKEYLQYAQKRLAEEPKLGSLYNQNHGIIALRDDFLRYRNLKGSDAANMDESELVVMPEVMKDVILCPIATIGCGKTTLGLALTHLFGWGHIQNDDIYGKARPPRFTKAVLEQLKNHAVVFADRNNAQRRERSQMINDVRQQHSTAKIVCLNFRHDEESLDDIQRVTVERVIARGDNHQTIHATTDRNKFISVMQGFVRRFEPCNMDDSPDDGFDIIIDLDPAIGSRRNLETVVSRLHQQFPNLVTQTPSPAQLDAAIEAALAYKPSSKHDMNRARADGNKAPSQAMVSTKQKKQRQLEYMSVLVHRDTVMATLEKEFRGTDAQTSRFYCQLKQTRRVQNKFHVTLMHRASAKDYPEVWKHYTTIFEAAGDDNADLGECGLLLERVVFDDRIMAIVVRLIDDEGKWICVNRMAHITVGTRDASVPPKESNDLLDKWLHEGVARGVVQEVVFEPKPTTKGTVRGVPSR